MKPYGLLRKIKHFKAKKDYHLHSKRVRKSNLGGKIIQLYIVEQP